MNTEASGGSRSLKSLTNLITATLVCVALAVLVGVAGCPYQLSQGGSTVDHAPRHAAPLNSRRPCAARLGDPRSAAQDLN